MGEDNRAEMFRGETVWYAVCRARESRRSDRVLNDPHAAHLVDGLLDHFDQERPPVEELAVALRVSILDEVLLRTIVDHHVHTVVTFAAGLDTRPYRLALPGDLRWVEVDSEPILAYKALRLANALPTCRLDRVAVDTTDAKRRDLTLRKVTTGVARGLLLTEGFDLQSPPPLGSRLPAGLKWWVLDRRSTDESLAESVNANQWRIVDVRSGYHEVLCRAARRLDELHSPNRPDSPRMDLGAVCLLRRSNVAMTRRRV